MAGHARVGRTYAGRVLSSSPVRPASTIGSGALRLLADDPAAFKEIVYEMRFDPVSAHYADFGPSSPASCFPAAACTRCASRPEAGG